MVLMDVHIPFPHSNCIRTLVLNAFNQYSAFLVFTWMHPTMSAMCSTMNNTYSQNASIVNKCAQLPVCTIIVVHYDVFSASNLCVRATRLHTPGQTELLSPTPRMTPPPGLALISHALPVAEMVQHRPPPIRRLSFQWKRWVECGRLPVYPRCRHDVRLPFHVGILRAYPLTLRPPHSQCSRPSWLKPSTPYSHALTCVCL